MSAWSAKVMKFCAICRHTGLWGALSADRPLRVTSGRKAAPISISAFGGKADVNHCVGECPFIAISGHSATRVISPNSSKIGCTEIPLESVRISLGVLRISGQPQRGTENSLFPCTPLKFLPSLRHASLAQRFDERLNGLHFQETQRLRHKAQRKARGVRKKLVECIPGFLHAPEFGERGR